MTNRVLMSLSVNVYVRVKQTTEFCNLNRNDGVATSRDSKKRARTVFGASCRDTKSSERTGSGTRAWNRRKTKFLLGP